MKMFKKMKGLIIGATMVLGLSSQAYATQSILVDNAGHNPLMITAGYSINSNSNDFDDRINEMYGKFSYDVGFLRPYILIGLSKIQHESWYELESGNDNLIGTGIEGILTTKDNIKFFGSIDYSTIKYVYEKAEANSIDIRDGDKTRVQEYNTKIGIGKTFEINKIVKNVTPYIGLGYKHINNNHRNNIIRITDKEDDILAFTGITTKINDNISGTIEVTLCDNDIKTDAGITIQF